MGPILLGIVAVIYLGVTFAYYKEGRLGLGLAFLGYSLANIGLIMDWYKK